MQDSSYYKITIGGRDEEHPLSDEDYKRVEDALKSRGYKMISSVPNQVLILAKIEPKMRGVDISALEGICTIMEDREMAAEMRSV